MNDQQNSPISAGAFFNAAPVLLVVTRNRDDGVYIEECNRLFLELLGYARAEVIGAPLRRFCCPELNANAAQKDADGACSLIKKNGAPLPALVRTSPRTDTDGAVIGKHIAFIDIIPHNGEESALLRSQEALRIANAELARALRLKDEFLANMSHELRTPLNAILNLSESLVEEIAGPLNEKQTRYSRLIVESGQHLLALIDDILDLSKIEAGRTELDIVPVAVEPTCQSSLRMVMEQAKKKRLTTSIRIDEHVRWVRADARRLKQMLVNLLGNAVKFTPDGGKIGIEVTGHEAAGKVVFAIWDTGIGIAPQDLSRLFRPFVQLDSGLTRQYAGTGLGLALVSRMARMHGGGVSVASAPGQGSRFTIELPWSPERGDMLDTPALPQEPATPEPVVQRSAAPLILLVDNVETAIAPIISFLEANRYRTAVARSSEESIALARALAPDLILMDIQMPDVDWQEGVRRIRAEPGLASVPIIALTALVMPGDRERCLTQGLDDYLAKPVSLHQLAGCIETHLARG